MPSGTLPERCLNQVGRLILKGPAESRWVAVRLQIPYGSAPPGSHPIHFDIGTIDGDAHVREKSVFLVPRLK